MNKEAIKKSLFAKSKEENNTAGSAQQAPLSDGTQQSDAQGLPLFFRRPAPLDVNRHRKAGIVPTQDFSFAAGTNSIPLTLIEFPEVAKCYPIVFTADEVPAPVAVVGLEKQNYFVGEDNNWRAGTYIPGYVRKYPFIFMDLPEREQFLLCVDEGAVHYKENGGDGAVPLYDGDQPSELTRGALDFCTMFQNHHQLTRQFCEAAKKADLFAGTQSDAKLFNGREIHLGGFQVIDEAKLNNLSDENLLEFRKAGFLPFLYFALMSGSNWTKLVDLAAEVERKKKAN